MKTYKPYKQLWHAICSVQQDTTALVIPVHQCPVAQRVGNVKLGSTAQRVLTSPAHVTQGVTARQWVSAHLQETVQRVSE